MLRIVSDQRIQRPWLSAFARRGPHSRRRHRRTRSRLRSRTLRARAFCPDAGLRRAVRRLEARGSFGGSIMISIPLDTGVVRSWTMDDLESLVAHANNRRV